MTEINTVGTGEMPWDEIASYVSDQMTADAREAFERRLASDSVLRATTERVRGAMGVWAPVVDEVALEAARGRMWAKAWKNGSRRSEHKTELFGVRREGGWFGKRALQRVVWPAGALAVLLVAFFVFRVQSTLPVGTTRSYVTGVNQQGILTLDDGTRVTLAPQTTLRLVDFSSRTRVVSVEGTAYFEVAHVAGAPFEVRSGSVTTRVLGTAFLVNHTPHSSHVRVAVEEGKVRISDASRNSAALTVSAGYVGEISDSSMTVDPVVDSASGTEWRHGMLVFYHMPLATVLQTLSRWYGYEFRCADSTLPQREVNIGLSMRSPAVTFATLEQVLGVSLTITGDTVALVPQRGNPGTPRVRSYDVWTPLREVGR